MWSYNLHPLKKYISFVTITFLEFSLLFKSLFAQVFQLKLVGTIVKLHVLISDTVVLRLMIIARLCHS